jgi:hypothetical protein
MDSFTIIRMPYICMRVCVCISRDRKNVLCFTAIDGRLVDLTRILVYV